MIRVVRLMEYEFDTPEFAEQHMASMSIPANGLRVINGTTGTITIRSTSFVDFSYEGKPKEND